MKLKLLVQILFLSSFSYILQAISTNSYVCNYNSNTVSNIDIGTNTVYATISVGSNPIALAVTPDGSKVYVCNYNDNTVSVINTVANSVIATISLSATSPSYHPSAVAITSNGSYAYICNTNNDTSPYHGYVYVIDTSTQSVVQTIEVESEPSAIEFTPDGAKAYVCDLGNASVSSINTSTYAVTHIGVGQNPSALAITPDSSKVYVCNSNDNTVSVINTSTNTVSATISGASFPYAVAITPDGTAAFVGNYGSNSVSVINTLTNTVSYTVSVGLQPISIAIIADSSEAYVSDYGGSSVSVINNQTQSVEATISVGSNPRKILVTTLPFSVMPQIVGVAPATPQTFTISAVGGSGLYTNYTLATGPTSGASVNPSSSVTGTFTYTPKSGTYTDTSLTFTATDSSLATSAAGAVTVVVEVLPVGTTTSCIVSQAGGAQNYTLGATGGSGSYTTYTISNFSGNHGTLTQPSGASSPSIQYTPTSGIGTDTFTYTVTDSLGVVSAPKNVTMSVQSLPTANSQSLSVVQNVATSITLTGTHHGGTGSFTFRQAASPSDGSLTGLPNTTGVVTYTANTTFAGQDTFTFTVTDTAGTSTAATVYINVLPVSARVYVTDQDNGGNYISPITIATSTKGTDIPGYNLGSGASALVVSPDGTKAYVCYALGAIQVVDTITNTTIGYVAGSGLLNSPNTMAISPDGTVGYVCNQGNDTISILNTSMGIAGTITGNVTDVSSFINNPVGIVFTPDGTRAYVANFGNPSISIDGSVSVIDVASNTVVANISDGSSTQQIAGIAMSPNGNFAYIVIQNGGSAGNTGFVRIINTNPNAGAAYNTFIGTINGTSPNFFNGPVGMSIAPNGSKAYVNNQGSGTGFILVINLNPTTGSGSVVQKISGFDLPESVAFSADGLYAYVTNFLVGSGNSSVKIVTVSSDTLSGTLATGYTDVSNIAVLGPLAPVATTTALAASLTGGAQNYTLGATGGSGVYTKYTISNFSSNHGTLTQPFTDSSPVIQYTPSSTGNDTFDYTVTDSNALVSAQSHVTITVENVVAVPQSASFLVNTSGNTIPLAGSGGTAPYTFIQVTPPSDASSYSLDTSTGVLTYTPQPGFVGIDHGFTYNVRDNLQESSTVPAIVTITITSGDIPVANSRSAYSFNIFNCFIFNSWYIRIYYSNR